MTETPAPDGREAVSASRLANAHRHAFHRALCGCTQGEVDAPGHSPLAYRPGVPLVSVLEVWGSYCSGEHRQHS